MEAPNDEPNRHWGTAHLRLKRSLGETTPNVCRLPAVLSGHEAFFSRGAKIVDALVAAHELTPRQAAAVAFMGGNLLVEAVPGSGKTRVIVARCAALLARDVAPAEILLLTFSRRGVGELRTRLARALPPGQLPEVRTFHGFAAHVLGEAGEGGHSRRLLAEPSERALFASAVRETFFTSLEADVAQSELFRKAALPLVADLRRAAPAALERLGDSATPRLADLLLLFRKQESLRARLGVADFDDLVARVVSLAAKPDSTVAASLRGRYRHVLVDEFQDTDPLQLELMRCFNATVFAVGDAAQAIYGFRGAAHNALELAVTALGMKNFPLNESFRCPENVCALARAVQPGSQLTSNVTCAGEIDFRRAASPRDEAALIGEQIAGALARGTSEENIAVLVRATEPLARLVIVELRARGIAVARRGGENVLDDPAVDITRVALETLAEPGAPEVWERLLGHPAFGFAPLALRRALEGTPLRGIDAACAFLDSSALHGRISGSVCARALRTAYAAWLAGDPVEAARAFAHGTDLLGFVLENADENAVRRANTGIESFLEALADVRYVHARLGLDTSAEQVFHAFVAGSAQWRTASDALDDEPGVRVLTVHAAKGLEFDFVAIVDAVEDHFPQPWRRDALLKPDDIELARACEVDLGTRSQEHDTEERSLWYVAVTRTKRKLLVTWSETALDGTPQRPSRYVPLLQRTRAAETKSFRGEFTYAAAATLLEPQPLRSARLSHSVSPSAMDSWLKCRRQFYYKLVYAKGAESGMTLQIGNLVHATIARFHGIVFDFQHVPESAHVEWAETLRLCARKLVALGDTADRGQIIFDTPLEREAALRQADRLLSRYARSLEESVGNNGGFKVVATEQTAEFAIDGVAFYGRIDRIDRLADGSRALIDVKTSKKYDTDKGMLVAFGKLNAAVVAGTLRKTAVDVNPQLALYRRAVDDASALEYLYLGTSSREHEFKDAATVDRLTFEDGDAGAAGRAALESVDAALSAAFFKPWTEGEITELLPTINARTCKYCDYKRVCPGYLEDDAQ